MPESVKQTRLQDNPPLTVNLLGPMSVRDADGELIELPRKVRALFAYLLMRSGTSVPRQTLTAIFWGDRADAQARSSLRQALNVLKSALGDVAASVISTNKESVSIIPGSVRTDLDSVLHSDPSDKSDAEVISFELLEGLALPEPAFEDWLRGEREGLRSNLIDTQKQLAASDEVAARLGDAAARLAAVVKEAPTDEEAHRGLMRIYLAEDRTDLAVKQFERCKELLREQLNVPPEGATVELWEQARRARSSANTPKNASTPRPIAEMPFLAGFRGPTELRPTFATVNMQYDGVAVDVREGMSIAAFSDASEALRACIDMRSRSRLGASEGTSPVSMVLHTSVDTEPGASLGAGDVSRLRDILDVTPEGEIYVSSQFFNSVRRNSPCFFDDLSNDENHQLKGVFRVGRPMQRQPFLAVYNNPAPRTERRPNTLAVAPIKYVGTDANSNDYWAEGLTEDLILELSRTRLIEVCSRTTLNAIRTHDAVEIGDELGVAHVLSGSFRIHGQAARLNFTLAETETGGVVWSERFNTDFDALFDVLDEIVAKVVARIVGKVEHSAIESARLKRPENMTAYEYYLRGVWHHRLGGVTAEHSRKAVYWFKKAVEADPNFYRPNAMMICAWSDLPEYDEEKANQIATSAYESDPTDPELNRILAWVKFTLGEFDTGIRLSDQSVELAPHDAYLLGRCAVMHIFNGDPKGGLERLDRAVELDPFVPVYIVEEYLTAYYAMGDFEKVVAEARNLHHQTRRSRCYTAASLVALGRVDAAREVVRTVLEDDPVLTLDYVRGQEFFRDKQTMDTLLDRLRVANLPE